MSLYALYALIVSTALSFVFLVLVFRSLELVFPAKPGQRFFRRAWFQHSEHLGRALGRRDGQALCHAARACGPHRPGSRLAFSPDSKWVGAISQHGDSIGAAMWSVAELFEPKREK